MEEQKIEEKVEAPKAESSAGDDQAKLWGILGYLVGITFFIPLVIESLKNNKYSKFHANQQLLLLIAGAATGIISSILALIPFIGWVIAILAIPVMSIAIFVFVIMGVINAAKGEMKPLPLIGKIEIIK